jgi:uncharacterized protein YkwD
MKKGLFIMLSGLMLFVSLTSFAPARDSGVIDDVLSYTNKFRKSHSLQGLIMKEDLNDIAEKHSQNMARGRVGFGHTGFNQRFSQARKSIKGIHKFAENVAYGARSGKDVVTMWKNSSVHRKNMLGKYRYIGIGIAKDRRGRIYYTQVFAN